MLQAPDNLGLGRTQAQAEHEAWDSYTHVFEQLTSWGFIPPGRPSFPIPDIEPERYARLEGDAYPRLMGQVDAWFAYTRSWLAEIANRLICIRNEMDMIGVDLRRYYRTQVESKIIPKKPTESELSDLLKEQPRYRELMKYEQDFSMMQKHVDAILDGLERHAKGLSRQITIRGQEIDVSGAGSRNVRGFGR
jgi:hypothetical protein